MKVYEVTCGLTVVLEAETQEDAEKAARQLVDGELGSQVGKMMWYQVKDNNESKLSLIHI